MSTVSSSSSNPYQYGASVFKIWSDLNAVDTSGTYTASDIAKAAQTAQTAGNTDEFVLLSNMLQASPNGASNTLFNGQTTLSGNDLLQLASADQGADGANSNTELTDNDITNTFGSTVALADISSTDLTNIAAGTQTNLSNSSTAASSSSDPMTQILQLLIKLLMGGQTSSSGTTANTQSDANYANVDHYFPGTDSVSMQIRALANQSATVDYSSPQMVRLNAQMAQLAQSLPNGELALSGYMRSQAITQGNAQIATLKQDEQGLSTSDPGYVHLQAQISAVQQLNTQIEAQQTEAGTT